jgi:hypothetical protein
MFFLLTCLTSVVGMEPSSVRLFWSVLRTISGSLGKETCSTERTLLSLTGIPFCTTSVRRPPQLAYLLRTPG